MALLIKVLAAAAVAMTTAYGPIVPLIPFPSPPPPSNSAPFQLLADRGASPALGVDSAQPLLSWAVPPTIPIQGAARVVVTGPLPSTTALWDSGNVSTQQPSTRYGGPALARATRYAWTVQVSAAGSGMLSDVSAPAEFSTGLHGQLSPQPPTAPLWAPAAGGGGAGGAQGNNTAMYVFLRAEVRLTGAVGDVFSAVAYVTASPQISPASAEVDNSKLLGAYKLWVNGQLAGVGPGKASRCGPLCPVQHAAGNCTCSPEQLYDTRDITALVTTGASSSGSNTLTLAIAAFNYPPVALLPTDSRVLLEVHIVYADGSTQVVGTEASSDTWRALDATPYMRPNGNMGMGAWYISPRESFDARLEPVGWREPGYDASAWPAATAVAAFSAPLVSRPSLALTITDDQSVVSPPVEVLYYGTRMFVDFGVDFTGGACLDVQTGVSGLTLFMSLAEEMEYTGSGANLTLSARPMRTGNNYTQEWTLREGQQSICMHEYAQFRYVDFTAMDGITPLGSLGLTVRAWVVYYPAAYVPASSLTLTSNGGPGIEAGSGGDADVEALSGVWALSWYTRAAQGMDMYFDHVRQRDVYCVEELTIDLLQQYALSTEWQLQPFTLAYIINNRPLDSGWAEWPALVIFSIHEIFLHSGDLDLFNRHYAQLRNFTEVALVDVGGTGLWTCDEQAPVMNCNNPEVDWPPASRDGFVFTPTNTVVNSIVYRALIMFAEMAAAAGGQEGDVAYFTATAQALRAAINSRLWDSSRGLYVDGMNTTHAAWHSSAFALGMGVPDNTVLQQATRAVVGRLPAGNSSADVCFPSNVWPTQWALEGLYRYAPDDHGRLALAVLTCIQPQGWVTMLINNNTQAPEAWNDALKGNEEQGMTWGAAPGDVLPRLLLGILPSSPGFASVLVRPQPGSLGGVSGTVPTIRGPVTASYEQTTNGANGTAWSVLTASLSLQLPGNVPATVCLPISACSTGSVEVDGVLMLGEQDGDYLCVNVTAAGVAPRRLQCP